MPRRWLQGPANRVLFHPLRRLLHDAVDRRLYRARHARRLCLLKAAETLGRAQPAEAVRAFLTEYAAQRLELTGAWLSDGPPPGAGEASGGRDGDQAVVPLRGGHCVRTAGFTGEARAGR